MFLDRLGKKSSWKPKFYAKQSRTTDYGEPMDIDAVTYQRDRQGGPSSKSNFRSKRPQPAASGSTPRPDVTCYNCGKKGRFAVDCRGGKKNEGGKPQEPRRNSYDKGKKKFTPTQLRHHIRALMTDAFEEDSGDYEKFLEEVDEKGF